MATLKSRQDEVHEHFFGPTGRCSCGWRRIPTKTYLSQCNVWENFYEMCKNTESGRSYRACGVALKNHDVQTVKDLAQKARDRLERNEYLPKPDYADPMLIKHVYGDEWVLLEGQPLI